MNEPPRIQGVDVNYLHEVGHGYLDDDSQPSRGPGRGLNPSTSDSRPPQPDDDPLAGPRALTFAAALAVLALAALLWWWL